MGHLESITVGGTSWSMGTTHCTRNWYFVKLGNQLCRVLLSRFWQMVEIFKGNLWFKCQLLVGGTSRGTHLTSLYQYARQSALPFWLNLQINSGSNHGLLLLVHSMGSGSIVHFDHIRAVSGALCCLLTKLCQSMFLFTYLSLHLRVVQGHFIFPPGGLCREYAIFLFLFFFCFCPPWGMPLVGCTSA